MTKITPSPISLLNDIVYLEDKPAIKVLLETSFTKEIRIVMKKGQEMKKHQTPFPIVIQMIEGTIQFGVDNAIIPLQKGDLITLEGGVPHYLISMENCAIRLTLSRQDQTSRVQKIID